MNNVSSILSSAPLSRQPPLFVPASFWLNYSYADICVHARNLWLKVNLEMYKTLLPGFKILILDFRDPLMVEHVDLYSLSAA